ncbi:MAG: endo-1,4-beta-xylanase [Polyangiaceae bacterium]
MESSAASSKAIELEPVEDGVCSSIQRLLRSMGILGQVSHARRSVAMLMGLMLASAAFLSCTPRSRPQGVTPSGGQPTTSSAQAKSSAEALALPSLSDKLGNAPALGVAVEPYLLEEQGPVVAKHFRRLVAENSMKWGEVCRTKNGCDFKRADAIADFARTHGMKMTGHTFVWHQMYPAWLFRDGLGSASKEVLTERLREHISQMVQRYADVVDNWDVVNEAISDKPERMWRQKPEQSKWFEAFGGEGYVEVAFRLAAEATSKFAPDTKLFYNDYSIENPEKRHKVIEMIRELRKKGVRVDGVGIQGHVNLTWPAVAELARAIDEFAAERLLVKVSELDVSVYPEDDLDRKAYQKELSYTQELEERLAQRYVEIFRVFRAKASALHSVTLWGLSDDHTWLNGWPVSRRNYPLLIDRTHRPKLAMQRLLELQ